MNANPLEFFRHMGIFVDGRWRDKNYDYSVFPGIAAEALAKYLPAKYTDPWDVIRCLDTCALPSQQDVGANFSNLPITLFTGTRFYIDVYFWLDGTTAIHQHGFAGAFQVLMGSSLHSHYDFTPKHIISSHFATGRLCLKKVQMLSQGDIKQIIPGKRYIHSLFHLDRPSATITVRTLGIPTAQPQFNYLKPGIAYDPFLKDPGLAKKVQSVNLLLGMPHPRADSMIKQMLSESDLQTAFMILDAASQYLSGNVVERHIGVSLGRQRFDKLLESVRIRHGRDLDIVSDAFAEARRQEDLIERRKYVTSTELRFFLALLLNLSGRKRILRLIHQRFPDQSPIETVLNWIEELSRIRVLGPEESNALGIEGFGDQHTFVIECQLKGKSLGQTQQELRKIFRSAEAHKLDAQTKKIFESLKLASILTPLFAPDA